MIVLDTIGKTTDTLPIQKGSRVSRYWNGRVSYFPNYVHPRKLDNEEVERLTAMSVCQAYNFSSIEFGNWVNQNERQNTLANLSLSSDDLAKVLGVPKNVVGMQDLSFAFGARGNGGGSAAFYIPSRRLINLTKPHGASSLAHEYAHAIDYRASRLLGEELKSTAAFRQIIKREKPANEIEEAYYLLMYAIYYTKSGKRTAMFNDSLKTDKPGYWASPREMFARAYEAWVKHELEKKGLRNYFLTSSKYGRLYPSPSQMKQFSPHFRVISRFALGVKVHKKTQNTASRSVVAQDYTATSISQVLKLPKYAAISDPHGQMLYAIFKNRPTQKIRVPDGTKEQDVFEKHPQFIDYDYSSSGYSDYFLTDLGISFIQAIEGRKQTLQQQSAGTDLFPKG